MTTFINAVEDALFRCIVPKRADKNATILYKQDEVQIHCYDEYEVKFAIN